MDSNIGTDENAPEQVRKGAKCCAISHEWPAFWTPALVAPDYIEIRANVSESTCNHRETNLPCALRSSSFSIIKCSSF